MNKKTSVLVFLVLLSSCVFAAPTDDVGVRDVFTFLIQLIGGLTLQGLDSIELVLVLVGILVLFALLIAIIFGVLWFGKKIIKAVIA